MSKIRPFTNLDPPAVTEVWQRCAGQPGLALPVSMDSFERLVFSKLYFPQSGFFLAFEGDKPLGMAHGAFGPNRDRSWISTEKGVVCMLLVRPECPNRESVARQLLDRCEHFLVESGSATIQGGAAPPLAPFYVGLYGGSMPPGIFTTDRLLQNMYASAGYETAGRTAICRRSLAGFRAPIDRQTMRIRRSMRLNTIVDPPPQDRWEAMEIGDFDLTRFELAEQRSRQPVAFLTVRDMGPLSPELPGPAIGIVDLFVAEPHRKQGLAGFLLGESFKQLMQQGVASVEAHLPEGNPACTALFRKMGLEKAAEAVRFRKQIS